MKNKKYFFLAAMLTLSLTGCSSNSAASDTSASETEAAAVSSVEQQEVEEGEGCNAIYYQGERYYGLVMYSTEIPENLELIGTAADSSVSAIGSLDFSGDAVPTEELQTNWTEAGESIYAEYDETGAIVAFWTEPGAVTGEAAYLGPVVSKQTPAYYALPDGEAPVV